LLPHHKLFDNLQNTLHPFFPVALRKYELLVTVNMYLTLYHVLRNEHYLPNFGKEILLYSFVAPRAVIIG
jgi:hypothetical protein